jgi:ABC-type glutathione transport system ATPase component
MSSIFNWVGLLLQRLYDVFPNSPHPELEPALILIDEIDAHLHPDWQRRLVALVQENFPNVQVIATSHSPLVAGALGRDEIRILRNGNAYEPSEDMKGMSVQDVMMSSSFSMRSPRATPGEKIISRYLELFAKPERSNPEETEFQELAGKFGELRYGTSEREDRIRKAVYQVLRQESPEETDLDSETRLLIEKELGAASVHLPAGDE